MAGPCQAHSRGPDRYCGGGGHVIGRQEVAGRAAMGRRQAEADRGTLMNWRLDASDESQLIEVDRRQGQPGT
ncbi:hypothetical protein N9L68_00280 [bacterium]|nr:hypothetical protein [bacterium]